MTEALKEREASMLRGIDSGEIALVAAAVLGVSRVELADPPTVEEIISPHGDPRTVALLKVSGSAPIGPGTRPWSTVAKVIDFGVEGHEHSAWVRPENEEAVYGGRYFAGDGLRFRPAHCYRISHPRPQVTVLWLEDLTGATGAPFPVADLARMAEHLGEWNDVQARRPPPSGLQVARDSVFFRWQTWRYEEELAAFAAMRDTPAVRTMYRNWPIEMAFELRDLFLAINKRAERHARTLCYGDINIGNVFWTGAETVAIDWASLTMDPTGVDAGTMIGSAISWGGDAVEIARQERALFARYHDGLRAGGWRGEHDDLRRGYLTHFGHYLLGLAMMPSSLRKYSRKRVEQRMGALWDEIPAQLTGIIDEVPSYLKELRTLLE